MDEEKSILIIEDNKPIRKLFATLLKKSDFITYEFDNATDSLKWLEENTPDLIIMDILLPDLNGTELITKVKANNKNKAIPIVAITGFATGTDEEKYLQLGFDAYIAKPVNTSTFVRDIKKALK